MLRIWNPVEGFANAVVSMVSNALTVTREDIPADGGLN